MPALLERMSSRRPAAKNRATYERMQRDLEFLSTFRDRLVTKYDEQWVAVFKEAVVAHSHDVEDLLAQLRKQSISPDEVVVDYLTSEQRALIL
jgi:hypothetical protein